MNHYAYIIADPTGIVFYVGKGKGYRVKRHLQGASHSDALSRRIADIRAVGGEPLVGKLECSTHGAALNLERGLIRLLGRADEGEGQLLNRTAGGQGSRGRVGFKHSDQTKARIAATCSGQKRCPRTRDMLREAAARRYADPVQREAWNRNRQLPKTISPEGRERIREAGRNSKSKTPEHMAKMAKAAAMAVRGAPKTLEHRAKLSAAKIGKPRGW